MFACVGTVPVYLGDAEHLRSLLPDPRAAIFVADFNNDYAKLAQYLNYLTTNETAYEEHRAWRKGYSESANTQGKPLLKDSWFCRVCQWVVATAHNATAMSESVSGISSGPQQQPEGSSVSGSGESSNAVVSVLRKRTHICTDDSTNAKPIKAPADWEGKSVRGHSSKQVYVVKDGALRGVPDPDTFYAMGFTFEQIMVVGDREVEAVWHGDMLPRIAG